MFHEVVSIYAAVRQQQVYIKMKHKQYWLWNKTSIVLYSGTETLRDIASYSDIHTFN